MARTCIGNGAGRYVMVLHLPGGRSPDVVRDALIALMQVQRLLALVRLFSRLPEGVGRGFAGLLDAATVPFDEINYQGSRVAARYFNRHRMGRKFDRVIASLRRSLAAESGAALRRGMHFPARWDPFFSSFMTLEDVYRYPAQHFEFHQRQLTLHPDR